MYGRCENCGCRDEIECCYSEATGQEIYLCHSCENTMTQEEKQGLADDQACTS